MTQSHRDQKYGLQAFAQAQRTVIQQGPELWADQIHTDMRAGHHSPQGSNRELSLRALFRAIRILEAGNVGQKKKAADIARFLENAWGLKQACVAIGGKELDVVRELREQWGDAQLPPVDALVADASADELLIAAAVRRIS